MTRSSGVLAQATTRSDGLPVESSQVDFEFESAFLAHYEGVYRLLFSIVGTREQAEDLAQETFVRLHGQRFAADRKHNLRAWLYRVATNLAFNALRGNKRRELRQEAASRWINGDPLDYDPAQIVELRAARVEVRRVLADLPERQARLLFLRYAGLSYTELAEVLEVAPGSVGTLLTRAHKAFEKAYRELAADQTGGERDDVR